ncbi:Protein pleiotropic regulatory locus 1 [Ranunculus cassubicifolius]
MSGGGGAAATLTMEQVEPQSLKKLSLKSLKRALDLFSPLHGHYAQPDPQRYYNITLCSNFAAREYERVIR